MAKAGYVGLAMLAATGLSAMSNLVMAQGKTTVHVVDPTTTGGRAEFYSDGTVWGRSPNLKNPYTGTWTKKGELYCASFKTGITCYR